QPVALLHGIPGLARNVQVTTAIGLARLPQAAAFHVKQPAVVATRDALFRNLSVEKRCTAMHTPGIEQARAPLFVAENNQVLAENSDVLRPIGDLRRSTYGLPVAPQQFAARRARSYLRQLKVRMLRRSAVRAAIGRALLLRSFSHVMPPPDAIQNCGRSKMKANRPTIALNTFGDWVSIGWERVHSEPGAAPTGQRDLADLN